MEENRYQVPENFAGVAEEREFWARIIADQLASRMGGEKFCELHRLNHSKFHYWKYHKVRPDCIGAAVNKKRQYRDKKANKFISLQISPDRAIVAQQTQKVIADRNSKAIEIIFKNGHKLVVPEANTEDNLALLIKAVGEL